MPRHGVAAPWASCEGVALGRVGNETRLWFDVVDGPWSRQRGVYAKRRPFGREESGKCMATVVGMFEESRDVDRVIDVLQRDGFTKSQIGVVARHEVLKRNGLDVSTGAEVGAITGATTGGIAGVLIGLGALVIPGLQIVAAGTFLVWIGAMVLGLAAGAIGGGLVGALAGLGISETQAQRYAEGVSAGHILVTVQADPVRAELAADTLRAGGAREVDTSAYSAPVAAIESATTEAPTMSH